MNFSVRKKAIDCCKRDKKMMVKFWVIENRQANNGIHAQCSGFTFGVQSLEWK